MRVSKDASTHTDCSASLCSHRVDCQDNYDCARSVELDKAGSGGGENCLKCRQPSNVEAQKEVRATGGESNSLNKKTEIK